MNNVWLKRLSGLTAMCLVASLALLTGCNDCDDDCGKKKKKDCCDERRVTVHEGEWRPVSGTAAAVESVSPWQVEEQYWRTNYSTRPYMVAGASYEQYAPAYRYGYDTRRRYQGQRFDDVEKDLARDWDHMRENSKLTWEQARPAVRDSWDRGQTSSPVSVRPIWENEEQYWRTNYSARPYFSAGATYEDYSPAYRYGYETRARYPGRRFEDVEVDLGKGWDSAKQTSKLSWEKAKAATRDAWDRADRAVSGERR